MTKLIIILSILVVLVVLKKLFNKDTFINKFITPFIQLISAVLIGSILLPLGFLYDLGKSIKERKVVGFFKSFWTLIKELLLVIAWLVGRVAFAIDLLGNVVSGELLEDIITSEEETLFRKGDVSISASTGDLKVRLKLNKVGKFFDKLLDFFFEKNHSFLAFENYLNNKN